MDYALVLYFVLSILACASVAAVFYLAWYPHASQRLRRWFLVVLANTLAVAALVGVLMAPRLDAGRDLRRVLQLSRSMLVCLHAFVVPHFVHAYLPPPIAAPASAGAAIAALAAAVLEIADLPRAAGMVIAVVILYSFLLCLALAFRLRRRMPPDPDAWVLRTVVVVSAFFVPGLLLQIAAAYHILDWRAAARLLRFELTPVCLVTASLTLLLRLRTRLAVPVPARPGAVGSTGSGPPTDPGSAESPPAGSGTVAPGIRLPERLLAELSQREREVVEQVLQGHTNREISDALFIAESTVKKHINSAFRKLHVSSRWQLLKLQQTGE